jgi:hypothetical protein
VERFYLFQKFWDKAKTFDVFQFLFCKSKTFLFIPKILEQNQNFLRCSNFFLAKAKRFDLVHKFLKPEQNFLKSQKNLVTEKIDCF